ncbi:DUF2252 domain-containing protein [Crenobacter sp. SG2303]|uniref:DUF2252 domain-containing protein n=1 Tax=Crenobacter oryzisoli TaxID=3056844 RepID=A0ABT7XUY4_9NEIS|nr:DUF2252 domain-containing protein [Crenobacter sp. SG2303]MDN0077614.1 DUF2252 domain-containing protein [Crenobacter sp. SG2303]
MPKTAVTKSDEATAQRPATETVQAQEDTSNMFGGRGSRESRITAGKAARQRVPRAQLATCTLVERDPIALLEKSNEGRLPNLIPIRYGRMVANPFAFYRGAAPLMAFDLAKLPRTDITVQLSGDAHLANFGLFASPERRILFGPNDFDETLPGPFDWDVRRLAASFVITARERGFKQSDQLSIVRRLCATFRERIAAFSLMDTLDVWYYQFGAENMLAIADTALEKKKERAVISKARGQSSRSVMSHATELVNGKLCIKDQPPLIYHFSQDNPQQAKQFDAIVRHFFAEYRMTLPDDRRALFDRYELVDMAVRVVGVGSVGTRCFEALFMADGQSPLFLQVKEARASVLEEYLPGSKFANHGERVVHGQRLLQSASDLFLGWSRAHMTNSDFYVRQLRDMKGAFDFTAFNVEDLSEYAVSCGHALAHSMAKAGDSALIYGYVGKSEAFDDAIVKFAQAYAEQNEADWEVLKKAVKAGRVQVERE